MHFTYDSEDSKIARAARLLDLDMNEAMALVERETAVFLERIAQGSTRSAAARYASHKVRLNAAQMCKVCGKTFAQNIKGHVICSPACHARLARQRKEAANPRPIVERECPGCHKSFTQRRKDQVFCSKLCHKQINAKINYRKHALARPPN